MQIDLPIKDLLSIYSTCYMATHDVPLGMPEEIVEDLQAPVRKLREQLAKDYLPELIELEAEAQLFMMVTASQHAGMRPN